MHVTGEPFVGREDELARGQRTFESVIGGEGALLLFHGEAGLGKTRIVQAIAKAAALRDARVVWGRAWEAGGAPPFWPWVQIFRALGATDDPFAADDKTGSIDIPQARFAKFDSAARWLKGQARDVPLVLVLDDLHAADVSTLLFLQFLARDLAGSRLLVLGTYRDAEARLVADVAVLIAKIAREGEAIALGRLSPEEVLTWVRGSSSAAPNIVETEAQRIYGVTEGNPLFVHELLRVRGTNVAEATMTIGLRTILDEHLGRVSADTRKVLEIGSVLGRDPDPALVAAMSGLCLDDVARALHEAHETGVFASVTGGERLGFTHILLRERLYTELTPSRRAVLHAAAGEQILSGGGDRATATHHLLEGSSEPARIAEVARDAARIALGRLAFEDVSLICERVLVRYTADDELTIDLEILLGESLIRAGKLDRGQVACASAAKRAKELGRAAQQAQAALVYATDILTGTVDPVMVELLRDALDRLPEDDSPLRVRLLARYAASIVPLRTAEEAAEVLALGNAAIAMARRTGDLDTLLFALHYAGSAIGYGTPAKQRYDLTRELFLTAEQLGRPLTMLNIGGWWIAVLREHARPADAYAALERYERLAEEFPQPQYRWRVPMLRATAAALACDWPAAERLGDEALAIADEGEIRAGKVAFALFRLCLAHLRGDPGSIAPHAERIEALIAPMTGADGFRAWLLAAVGRHDEARAIIERLLPTLSYTFPWALSCGEAICTIGDVALGEACYPYLLEHARHNTLFWGPLGSTVFGPIQRIAADVARLIGKTEDARRLYGETIAIGERMEAPAFVVLAQRGLAGLDAAAPASITPASLAPASSGGRAAASIEGIELVREGEMWRVMSSTGKTVRLKDSKGLQYLAELVSRPGQELHVTQLSELGETPGDAGTVLDERAKRAYKQRLEGLRDQLEEARGFGDAARADRAQAEIDAIAEQLASAVGLGGRDRKIGSQVERVRINVQRRLRDAVQRIEEHDPSLGRYLSATIKTGIFCIFSPL